MAQGAGKLSQRHSGVLKRANTNPQVRQNEKPPETHFLTLKER